MNNEQNRNFGLDLCRAIAILLVVFGHMLEHSSPAQWLAGSGFMGMFGVDLFFCLSGFLIGRILIKESHRWHKIPQSGLLRFWYRRWMRTLPLYFFFLLVWLQWDWRGPTTLGEQLPYLLFAQNLAWPMSDFYLLTWSLAIEEWFYYLFPLMVLVVIAFGGSSRRGMLFTTFLFIVVPFCARILFGEQIAGFDNFNKGMRHIVIFRLDALGFGVATACLYVWYKPFFEKLAKLWPISFLLVAACIIMTKMGFPLIAGSELWMSVYLSISAIAFAGLIPFFNNIRIQRSSTVTRFIQFTSRISYSMYLGHIIAFIAVMNGLHWLEIFDLIYPRPWLVYPLFFLVVYALSILTYYCVEMPVLQLRDRNSKALAKGLRGQKEGL